MLAAMPFVHEPGYPVVWWERQCQAAFCTAAIKIQRLYPLKKTQTNSFQIFRGARMCLACSKSLQLKLQLQQWHYLVLNAKDVQCQALPPEYSNTFAAQVAAV